MALSKVNPNLITQGASGRKNLIINGGFDVAQRGTSFTGTQIYTLDRWYMDESGSTTTLTQETHTLGQTDVPDNPKYYLKMNTTTGANNCRIEQNIEGVHHAAGQSATLSFWAKGVNPAGGNYNINMNQLFGTGGSPSTETSVSLGTFTVTSSWVKKSFTVTLASISGKTLGTTLGTDHLKLQILQPDGDSGSAAWNLNISNIQFELGSVATDFEHRSYQEELLLCEWYFKKWLRSDSRLTDSDSRATYTGIAKAVNEAFFYMPFNMRVIPTSSYNDVAVHDAVGAVINAVGSTAYNAMGSFRIIVTNGLTTGDIVYLRFKSSASFMQFDAEL